METKATELEILGEMKEIFSISDNEDENVIDRKMERLSKFYPKIMPILLQKKVVSLKTMPKNKSDFVKLMQELKLDQLFSNLLNDEDYEGQYILDGGVLSFEAETLIKESGYLEQLQEEILVIRRLIKERGLPNDQYEKCRLFFIPENVVLENRELLRKIKQAGIDESLVNEIRNRFYIKKCYSGEVQLCPICGRHWESNHFEKYHLCKQLSIELAKKEPIVKQFKENDVVFELNKSTIKYTLIPNIGEILLRSKLLGLNEEVKVEMYPNYDEYDLCLIYKGRRIMLDIKDFSVPENLANYFNNDEHARKKLTALGYGNSYIVVMNYRTKLEPNYMERLRGRIKSGAEDLKKYFISEDELFERLSYLK